MSGLRIGMASPWNKKSAIAQSASEVAFELVRRGHFVTILRTETTTAIDLPVRPAPAAIRHISEYQDFELQRDFDIIVGQIGDHFGFHGALLPRLASVDVLGIFHDMSIPNLLRGWVQDVALLSEMAKVTYRATPASDGPFLWDDLGYASKYHPMIEWVATRTVGGIAHANHYAERLRRACPGPVAVIPLAFDVPDLPPPPTPLTRTVVAVIGHANRNKRIDQIIYSIGASYILRGRCQIRVIGEADANERDRLTALAQLLGVESPIFTGWVSEEDLRRELWDVDVISCLRNPVLEGASASLILGLLSGRPVLVTDHGCYAEVPADAALFCKPDSEALDAMIHLEHMVRDPKFGIETGRRGQTFAKERHTAAAYCDTLVPLLECCISARPASNAVRQLALTLGEFGLNADDPSIARAATSIETMSSEWV